MSISGRDSKSYFWSKHQLQGVFILYGVALVLSGCRILIIFLQSPFLIVGLHISFSVVYPYNNSVSCRFLVLHCFDNHILRARTNVSKPTIVVIAKHPRNGKTPPEISSNWRCQGAEVCCPTMQQPNNPFGRNAKRHRSYLS